MAIPNFIELETDILKKWKAEDVFKKTLEKKAPKGTFVFFEGPPTANGQPHIGHVETRAFKDIIPRFKTMQGYHVERKAGWDTQGLPVELEVEKAIGVSGKRDIEKYGIAKFNEECKKSVWKYKELWEQMTERVGFWLDLEHPYITYENSYIETLWWILKQGWDAGLLVQDYKVVPYCPRCGTALSSHELAQGYERVKDRSVYVKFELVDEPGTYILSWTTTPWTLPGNVALAVDPNIFYIQTAPNNKGQRFIVARELAPRVLSYEFVEGMKIKKNKDVARILKGNELVGRHYKPLFDFLDLGKAAPTTPALRATPPRAGGEVYRNAYTIVSADFVTTEEGTGVVHTAVMYGEDDFTLGSKLDLPKKHTVDLEGKFNELVKPWAGKHVKAKDTEDAIVHYLKDHGKLYHEGLYEHDYPFCWRCKTPLLYYAKTSWFITMSKLRVQLIENNEKIDWIPAHIKDGRFGEWLREVKDWAISRERYWGTPLPIWMCDACGNKECMGSYEQLAQKLPFRNRYFLMRHAEATNNVVRKISSEVDKEKKEVLTEKGKKQAQRAALQLKREKVDGVYSSEFQRTRETAEIIAQALGVEVSIDPRLNEYGMGVYEGKTEDEFHQEFTSRVDRFTVAPPGGETWNEVRKRLMEFLLELDRKHEGKTFVIVSHGDPIWVALWATSLQAESQIHEAYYPKFAEPIELRLPAQMLRPDGSFDPHRPFIDAVTYPCMVCKKGTKRRVPEVADTWFDSGSMPFAQWHYPFENQEKFKQSYPAEFISEAIDQTRGWFYTLLAISTFLQKAKTAPAGPPYENCVVLGHIRDKQGRKLSKSLGNYIDPMKLLDKYGADAVRMYLFTINQPSEPKNFDEAQLGEVVKKNFMILWNVLAFWKLHVGSPPTSYPLQATSSHVMDRWILARLSQLIETVTHKLALFAIVEAGRELTSFVTDLSTWYVRRSRERAKGDSGKDVVATLGYVLREYVKLSAPFIPFLSDALWRELGGKESVHLEPWPQPKRVDAQLLKDMEEVVEIVGIGHTLRAQAQLKVRQPLSQIVLTKELRPDLDEILTEELNVKEVQTAKKLPTGADWIAGDGVALDITITDELREEGYLREMIRAINALRKELMLKPGEPVALEYETNSETQKVVEHYKQQLLEKGSLSALERAESVKEPTVVAKLDDQVVQFSRQEVIQSQ